MGLILASTSPRRREILALLGVPFEVVAPPFDEIVGHHRSIEEEVLQFAVEKAASVAKDRPGSIVIGSDTMIGLDNEKIGKPANVDDAKRVLGALSKKFHCIYTSVAILDDTGGPGLGVVEKVTVKMRAFSNSEIESYLAHAESLDKAGAYSIQGEGRHLIEFIKGDYLAAVGMPLRPIARYLQERGIAFPLDVEKFYADKSFLNWRSFESSSATS
jgi:nucleoside triphosphate pyrophosphatase